MSELTLDNKIINALKTVFDPEIPVDIYELGLIYKCEVTEGNDVLINMTLTSPNCPVAEELPRSVQETVQAVEGVNEVKVDIVWEPPWDMSRMSEIARLELDMM
ncbi:SUF system Fe-S cluster assembly protein [Pelagibacterales bacterium]|jgi:FeS assembly SUF system protein|nr:SUF system Fe-S cluster assembly protein [Pelagibacterales bacterium]MDB9986461.1 SUF system Fe-S cluster assembly protein [Pelagibacterales bacterium]|tara:strand:- start:138 stop:449 length:312 start_codon:yes stop_codon:yes gene_type:complete